MLWALNGDCHIWRLFVITANSHMRLCCSELVLSHAFTIADIKACAICLGSVYVVHHKALSMTRNHFMGL